MSSQTEQDTAKETVTVTVDGREIEARPGEVVIAAAERAGIYIPRFCWHPRMKPVGMCRMCLVDIKGPRGFALQPACFVNVADGMEVVTNSEGVKKAQDGVLEFLLINHPLDCPVCDRGGECPLQDQTFAFGPGESRFVEEKRHFEKPIHISDLVLLDRERCIQCARCTRFADEIAGDPLINFVERGDQVQVLTFPDEPFASYFSGNTVQICPVGALLASPYRFRARPWDLEQVESTCTACSVGCRIATQSSSNRLIRYLGIDSDPVNQGWLCDKGRFSYEAVDHDERLGGPLMRTSGEGQLTDCGWGDALERVTRELRNVVELHGPASVAVLGGARLTNEDAYAWAKLAKGVLGTDSVDCQMGDGLPAELVLGLPRATIDEACAASTVVLLSADVKEELPVLYLPLRQAAIEGHTRILEVTPQPTGMTKYAAASVSYAPGEAAQVVRSLIDGSNGAGELLRDGNVVVVVGRSSVAESDQWVSEAARVLAGLPGVKFLPALRRSNVLGALDMGLAPGVLPGRVSLDSGRQWFSDAWSRLPEERGLDATGILSAAAEGRVQALILLGADPLADFPDRALARRALGGAGFVVAVDLFLTESARQADVVLAAAGPGEKSGTTTNIEGRVSVVNQKVTAPGTARPDWILAAELSSRLGHDLGFESIGALFEEIERLAPSHAGLTMEILGRPDTRDGVVVPFNPNELAGEIELASTRPVEAVEMRAVAAQSVTAGSDIQSVTGPEAVPASGDAEEQAADAEAADAAETAAPAPASKPSMLTVETLEEPSEAPRLDAYAVRLVSARKLYDAGVIVQHCPSLAHLAVRTRLRMSAHDLDRLGVHTGDRVKVSSQRGSATVEVEVDEGLPRGSASLTFNEPGEADAADLIDATQPVTALRVETVP
ncbi:MAG: NADH-quinone oxidoreductase subunit NuoG [Acidimicrobiia bacterium]|nr:NADH-quinone oxidoreductase subunit NuoG [Acidimicrobiia bacterium]